MIKLLIVDDHELVRTALTCMLDSISGVQVVGQAANGEEAVQKAAALQPDVVLMDVRMPGIGGVEATRRILRHQPEVRVIALTAYDDDPFPNRLLQAGAMGYITKDSNLDEMLNAIRKVHSGQRYISVKIAQELALKRFSGDAETSPFELLSEREMQIALMIINCQKVAEISTKLHLSSKTVNSHRYNIFEKLGIESDVALTHLALRWGLIDA